MTISGHARAKASFRRGLRRAPLRTVVRTKQTGVTFACGKKEGGYDRDPVQVPLGSPLLISYASNENGALAAVCVAIDDPNEYRSVTAAENFDLAALRCFARD